MLDPQKIINSFKLKKGDYVADFGSGHGYFVIPLSHAVGHEGKVYAIDIQRSMLDAIRTKAKVENLLNIEFIWANLEEPFGSKLKDGFIDFVLVGNILYQTEKKENIIREAYRILRPGGHLALLEWKTEQNKSSLGPAPELRISMEDVVRMCQDASFDPVAEFDAERHHYGFLFIKK